MKRFMLGMAIASAIAAPASASIQDVEPAGFVCEGRDGNATIFFDTQEGMAYLKINNQPTLKEEIKTWWAVNKFGHGGGQPPFYFTGVEWGAAWQKDSSIPIDNGPESTSGLLMRHGNSMALTYGYYEKHREPNGPITPVWLVAQYKGDCVGDYNAGVKLKTDGG